MGSYGTLKLGRIIKAFIHKMKLKNISPLDLFSSSEKLSWGLRLLAVAMMANSLIIKLSVQDS